MERQFLSEVPAESVGIGSRDIVRFVRALEESGTEMHGFVILRHGYIAAKGWWQPFAQNIPHSAQSLTKTVTGTAYFDHVIRNGEYALRKGSGVDPTVF